jgi:ribosomal protein S21
MINLEVQKSNNESNSNVLRKFTKRVQGAGILPRVRSLRYKTRNQSKYSRKKLALKVLKRRGEVAELIKMGKMPEKSKRGRR